MRAGAGRYETAPRRVTRTPQASRTPRAPIVPGQVTSQRPQPTQPKRPKSRANSSPNLCVQKRRTRSPGCGVGVVAGRLALEALEQAAVPDAATHRRASPSGSSTMVKHEQVGQRLVQPVQAKHRGPSAPPLRVGDRVGAGCGRRCARWRRDGGIAARSWRAPRPRRARGLASSSASNARLPTPASASARAPAALADLDHDHAPSRRRQAEVEAARANGPASTSRQKPRGARGEAVDADQQRRARGARSYERIAGEEAVLVGDRGRVAGAQADRARTARRAGVASQTASPLPARAAARAAGRRSASRPVERQRRRPSRTAAPAVARCQSAPPPRPTTS